MKVSAIILLCAFAAVQARSAVISNSKSLESDSPKTPWILHLRIAVSTSGYLKTGAASLITSHFGLTASSAVKNNRYIWVRFGDRVYNPALVLETNSLIPKGPLALISFFRAVEFNPSIAPVALGGGAVSKVETLCSFGGDDTGPGDALTCVDIRVKEIEEGLIKATDDTKVTEHDLGVPLTDKKAVQVAVLVDVNDGEGTFQSLVGFLDWIEKETGAVINVPKPPAPPSSESSADSSSESSADSSSESSADSSSESSADSSSSESSADSSSSESSADSSSESSADTSSSESSSDSSSKSSKDTSSKSSEEHFKVKFVN